MRPLIGGEILVNEIRLRRELEALRVEQGKPITRAKSLIRFARRAETAYLRLARMSLQSFGKGDPILGSRFGESARSIEELGREARNCARTALRARPLCYGYGPQAQVPAKWNQAVKAMEVA